MSLLPPSRRSTLLLLQLYLLLCCIYIPFIHCIPFSTSLWKRPSLSRYTGTHDHDTNRIPPFLRKEQTSSSSSTETVYSQAASFASSSSTTHIKEEMAPPPLSATSSTCSSSSSAHLKLNSLAKDNNKNDNNENDDKDKKDPSLSLLHTYMDTTHNISLTSLNVSKRKFSSWINHTLQQQQQQQDNTTIITFIPSLITSKQVNVQDLNVRQELRQLWRQGQLLTDRTEVLAVYKSDDDDDNERDERNHNDNNDESTTTSSNSENYHDKSPKRGGFSDLLHIYAERLFAIIEDEEEEYHISFKGQTYIHRTGIKGQVQVSPEIQQILSGGGLLGWLQREYGTNETDQLLYEHLREKSPAEQYQVFQHFLEWFRSRFPYYYDRCDSCGASAKDEPEIECIQDDGTNNEDADIHADDDAQDEKVQDGEDDNGSFLGYVYPSDQELLGKASRTEIYQCHKCGSFTRFPRYNAASSVIQNKRGRCGEYSMLLFRLLRATGHTSRWIVDWADHVWAEVYLQDKWIHLDPCEAAVDKPLLYEEWGKQQTYIVAFHAPLSNGLGSLDQRRKLTGMNTSVPLIEDVTLRYTTSDKEEIRKRRDESDQELTEFVDRTTTELKQRLDRILNR